ncbi:ABC transporter permease [Glutamicibacter sp. MNS18]|uniref:ABC transporter permease n=1 Tax=Glutamicibacter sp. MNS18 TaxID=2989817 RepID=UPI0022363407|nr:ABC transporter permease [Glutamicibacter sp. MNS18]MCW4467119.1 ABC transporter permease [Glutamicibacter sp. MNS18]
MTTQLESTFHGHVTLGGVLRSEAIRFFSLNSTRILILVAVLVNVLIAAGTLWAMGLFSSQTAGVPGMPDTSSPAFTAEMVGSGLGFGQLILGALGVLLISGEFTTGSAVSTFLASPQRLRVLLAKSILITVLTAVVTLGSLLLSYLVSKPIAQNYGMALEFAGEPFQRVLWYGTLGVVMAALMGLGLGTLLRNSAGGITLLAAIFFVLPIATQLLIMTVEWFRNVAQFLPDQVGLGAAFPLSYQNNLEIWQQMLGVAGWALIPLLIGAWLLKVRDI